MVRSSFWGANLMILRGYWRVGVSACRCVGVSVRRRVGVLVCWYAGMLVPLVLTLMIVPSASFTPAALPDSSSTIIS